MTRNDNNPIIGGIVLLLVLAVAMGLIYSNSRGDISYEKHRAATGECVEFVLKSNGWDEDLMAIRDC